MAIQPNQDIKAEIFIHLKYGLQVSPLFFFNFLPFNSLQRGARMQSGSQIKNWTLQKYKRQEVVIIRAQGRQIFPSLSDWLEHGASGKLPECQCRRHKRPSFDPWIWKISWRRVQPPIPVFLPGEFYGQRSLAGYSPQGREKSDITEATQHTGILRLNVKFFKQEKQSDYKSRILEKDFLLDRFLAPVCKYL